MLLLDLLVPPVLVSAAKVNQRNDKVPIKDGEFVSEDGWNSKARCIEVQRRLSVQKETL